MASKEGASSVATPSFMFSRAITTCRQRKLLQSHFSTPMAERALQRWQKLNTICFFSQTLFNECFPSEKAANSGRGQKPWTFLIVVTKQFSEAVFFLAKLFQCTAKCPRQVLYWSLFQMQTTCGCNKLIASLMLMHLGIAPHHGEPFRTGLRRARRRNMPGKVRSCTPLLHRLFAQPMGLSIVSMRPTIVAWLASCLTSGTSRTHM